MRLSRSAGSGADQFFDPLPVVSDLGGPLGGAVPPSALRTPSAVANKVAAVSITMRLGQALAQCPT